MSIVEEFPIAPRRLTEFDAIMAAVDDFTPSDAALTLSRMVRPVRTPAPAPQRRPEPRPIAALHVIRPLA